MAAAHTHLLPQVDRWVAEILKDLLPDEELTWQASFLVFPDESSDNAWLPVLVLYTEMALDEKQSFYSTSLLPPFVVNEAQIRQSLEASVLELQARRKGYLASQNGKVTESEVQVVTDLPVEG